MRLRPQCMIYYNWTDIEKFLSEAMGITDNTFSRRKSTGLFSYWNLWWDLNESFGNGIIENTSYVKTDLSDYTIDIYKQKIIDTYVDWDGDETILEFIDALKKLQKVVGNQITIYYSW